MNIFKKYKRDYWRNATIRLTLIFVTVVIIVWFMPRNYGQQLRYDIGKPWMYGSFIAKFDFPIYKTDEAIKAEQDSVMKTFQPYYNYNSKLEKEELRQFYHDFSTGIEGVPAPVVRELANHLHRLYQAGIISTPEYNGIARDTTGMVRIVNGKEAKSVSIKNIYSTMAAYESLLHNQMLIPKQ